ncbi:hypothetical protein G3O08_19805 [Cryomorpha ignava]|uniref:Uncharacterized protein n=1 Tax=Cryomorpha ignava TaxID=101383 RepID=A0A7K3WVK7_9FLAO|nr:hypothetical protein [Cryomorpha ignava]NEN25739.1 hypothetical protein [Cryomorpha ignava]
MKRLLTILLILASLQFFGQSGKAGKLKEDVNIDTLFVSIQFSDTADPVLQKELLIQFDTIVSSFNREEQAFTLAIDSTRNTRTINFLVGSVKYVDWKKNLWVTGLDLALIGVNILIIPYFPPVIPFYLMPSTICRVDLESSDDLFYRPTRISVNPNGYFAKRNTQKLRLKKKFDKVFYKYFLSLNKQNEKKNKP